MMERVFATPDHPEQAHPLDPYVAAALVFGASAAVLVVELVALRLLAPYLGLTLETSTFVIGTALAAIALGSWVGGHAADILAPRRMLGPLLAVSGVAVALTPFLIRVAGASEGQGAVVLVAMLALLVPGSALSAVTPTVTKLRLTDLGETGTVVGRLSGIATAGAIAGTVVTGFVLITHVPVTGILVGLGGLLVTSALAVEIWVHRLRPTGRTVAPLALVVAAAGAAWLAPGDCDVETTYHCAVVREDPLRASGRTLVLDGVRHSYVDLADPTHLEFAYVRALAAAAETQLPPEPEPVTAYHLGGGGMTFPRYLEHVRPGTDNVVSEIDPGVVRLDTQQLGLGADDEVAVRVEDGRRGLERLDAASRDLVVGDAFGGVSVPWHLTTREAMQQVRRVLAADGVYAANLIDHGPLAFARSAVATLEEQFDHVALAAEPATVERADGGNMVVVASDRPLDLDAWQEHLAGRATGWTVLSGPDLDAWVDGAEVLTDDHAPVDQLLTPFRPRAF
jgi:spermidine synthase